jgi:hypothetical protein
MLRKTTLPTKTKYSDLFPSHISLEEGDEREFLFAVQIPRDAGGLGIIRPDLKSLHGDVLFAGGLHAGC